MNAEDVAHYLRGTPIFSTSTTSCSPSLTVSIHSMAGRRSRLPSASSTRCATRSVSSRSSSPS